MVVATTVIETTAHTGPKKRRKPEDPRFRVAIICRIRIFVYIHAYMQKYIHSTPTSMLMHKMIPV